MKGNEAIAEAAIAAGCDAYFGYPITPQAELLEWMARRMPEEGRVFIQAESELAAINMALGASAAGARVMVSSSSPGISLMAEGMSYMAGSRLPVVLVNVMRGGPGLGSIGASQSDYLQATKGHGHGDYHVPVLAPASIAEAIDLVGDAFVLAERYRTPVMMLADGILGQAMEPVVPRFRSVPKPAQDWILDGAADRAPRVVRSLHIAPADLEDQQPCSRRPTREIIAKEHAGPARPRRRGDRGGCLRHGRPGRRTRRRAGPRPGLRAACSAHHAAVPGPGAPCRCRRRPRGARCGAVGGPAGRGRAAGDRGRGARVPPRTDGRDGAQPRRGRGRDAQSLVRDAGDGDRCRCRDAGAAGGGRCAMTIRPEAGPLPLRRPAADEPDAPAAPRTVYRRPALLSSQPTSYCPGCGHGIVHRLLAEVLEEMGVDGRTILVGSVGCAVFAYEYLRLDSVESPHGRAAAVATGIKRVRPDRIVHLPGRR
jgi:hypothetical protein